MAIWVPKTSFAKGEVTPLLHYRRELELYLASVKTARNWVVLKEGCITKRPGTRIAGFPKYADKHARFVRYTYSTGQSYLLEFGDLYVRFWTQGGLLTTDGITAYEVATPFVEADLDTLQFTTDNNKIYISHANYAPRVLTRNSSLSWTLGLFEFFDGPFLPTNDSATGIVKAVYNTNASAPMRTGQIVKVEPLASGSPMTGVSDKCSGLEITVTFNGYTSTLKILGKDDTDSAYRCVVTDGLGGTSGAGPWSTSTFQFPRIVSGDVEWRSYVADATHTMDVTLITSTQAAAVTGSLIDFTFDEDQGLTSADIGRHFRFQLAGAWSWGVVTAVTSGSVCTVEVKGGAGNIAENGEVRVVSTLSWSFGCFGTTPGWPACVCFYKGRLFWANTTLQPRGVFASMSGVPNTYSPTETDGSVNDNHGFMRDIRSDGKRADPILWMKESYRLLLGTASHIKSIGSADANAVLTPNNFDERVDVKVGAYYLPPVSVDESDMFVSRTGSAIHDMFTDASSGFLSAPEATILSSHLPKDVQEIVYVQVPDGMLWARRADGTLIAATIKRDEKVLAWHQHSVSGYVESLSSNATDERDELWMIVLREVNGDIVRTVEILDPRFDGEVQDKEDAFYVDGGLTYRGAPASTFYGLDHLEGMEVSALADGNAINGMTVVGGSVTLPNGRAAETCHIGLPIDDLVELLPAPTQTPDGSAIGHSTRVVETVFGLLHSRGLEVAVADSDSFQKLVYGTASNMTASPALYSGLASAKPESGWDSEGRIRFRCPYPLPSTVSGINILLDSEP